MDENGKALTVKGWFFTSIGNFKSKAHDAREKYIDKKDTQLSYVKKITGLQIVLTGESVEPTDLDKSVSQQTKEKKEKSLKILKNVYFSPFLVNKDGNNTPFLSASKLLKTITIMNDAVFWGNGLQLDPNNNNWEKRKIEFTFNGIKDFLESLLIDFGMIICCAIIMAEYILTILEFYLIRGLATLLIPFYFLDATKSYAENLIKIFFNYFFKILITIFVCFFSLGMFLEVSLIAFTTERESFYIVLLLVTLTIGTMFCSKIPNILSTLLSGNPSMGWGNIAETARGAAHGMHMAMNAANSAKRFAGGVVHAGQGVVRGGFGAAATLDSMASAYSATRDSISNFNAGLKPNQGAGISEGRSVWEGLKAAVGTGVSSVGQNVGDILYKGITGQEKQRDDSNRASLKYGHDFVDNQGKTKKADFGDMTEHAKNRGEKAGQERANRQIENYKKKSLPPDDQDSILNK